ncbi:hypothetical protein RHMOL_Rhmol01G0182300 [Rhododendron molle]|uniref:Uncharacterized protein n=1 Tax=Rhododendron molle TaxID=49168 RepID=A0ACC0Q4Q5_RHOML|nr:hypothetical protein RHMOL_Rhmol01G0182300 [Rhododendron molle]
MPTMLPKPPDPACRWAKKGPPRRKTDQRLKRKERAWLRKGATRRDAVREKIQKTEGMGSEKKREREREKTETVRTIPDRQPRRNVHDPNSDCQETATSAPINDQEKSEMQRSLTPTSSTKATAAAHLVGFQAIAEALGLAAVKAIVAITAIIAGGRLLLRPIYKQIAENQNAEIFSANTLFVILGTSLLTARAGLSMALGAFLAGLLLAETEFSLQVESDIAPYRGLLLGLFFMTVGMSIDPKLLVSNFQVVMGTLGLLIGGKTLLVAAVGKLFGISIISAIRVGLLLAPGGEFAFVAFGEAVNQVFLSMI